MARGGEWSRLINQDSYSSFLKKNSPNSSSLMFDLLRADALPDLTNVSGRMAQMTQFISWNCVLCRLISNDMITMDIVCLSIGDVCYYGGCVSLIVTMCN